MAVIMEKDLFNTAGLAVRGHMNKNRDVMPIFVDLTVAYYQFRYEIITGGTLHRIGFYCCATHIASRGDDSMSQKTLFSIIDDFMSGDEEKIGLRKKMIKWAHSPQVNFGTFGRP